MPACPGARDPCTGAASLTLCFTLVAANSPCLTLVVLPFATTWSIINARVALARGVAACMSHGFPEWSCFVLFAGTWRCIFHIYLFCQYLLIANHIIYSMDLHREFDEALLSQWAFAGWFVESTQGRTWRLRPWCRVCAPPECRRYHQRGAENIVHCRRPRGFLAHGKHFMVMTCIVYV